MADWTKTLVKENDTIREVMQRIDDAELQIALVIDEHGRLKGVITDGDLRRGLLRGATLDCRAREVMTADPVTATPEMRMAAIEDLMLEHDLHQVPVLDENGVIVSLALHGRFLPRDRLRNLVVLMVGGLGSRLGDLTRHTPKPLLRIAGKPILEIILDSLISQGFQRFALAINYKGEMIERYFGDGRRWGASIEYLREDQRLGTCGALSLLEERPEEPLIVMNGDILTKISYSKMLRFHEAHKGAATMAIRHYDVDIPFGVVDSEADKVKSLVEKPRSTFDVNAGMYVLNPEVIEQVPHNEYFEMTSLLAKLIETGEGVYKYPINDYWLDIGRSADFDQANDDFRAGFEGAHNNG